MQQTDTQQTTGGPPQHAQGTRLREYETLFLVRPHLAELLVDQIVERLRGIVHRGGGKAIAAGARSAAIAAARATWTAAAAADLAAARCAGTAPTRTSRSTTRTRAT